MGCGHSQQNASTRRGTDCCCSGRDIGVRKSRGGRASAINDHGASGFCDCRRSGRRGIRPGLGSTRRQYHRLYAARIQRRSKVLQLLKDVDPRVRRVAVLRDPAVASGSGQFGAIQAAASSFGVEVSPIGMRDNKEVARALDAFARAGNGGLIVTASPLATLNRELIVAIAMRGRLPAVYSNSSFALGGGLLSYSPDRVDQLRQAASYVDDPQGREARRAAG